MNCLKKSNFLPLSVCLFLASGTTAWPVNPAEKSIYAGLDNAQVSLANDAMQFALEKNLSYVPHRWSVNGRSTDGFVVPMRTYKIKSGHYCREFLEGVTLEEKETVSKVQTACRSDDGVWILVNPKDNKN